MKWNPSQRGVALVITLIMLSVITVIAVAFLAVSRRERTSVSHSVNYIDAELAMNTALERAKAEIAAFIVGTTNPLGPGYTVAMNIDGAVDLNGPIPEYNEAVIARLTNDARVPVFIRTNRNSTATEFRYYLDLNRNTRPDTNGLTAVLDNSGQPVKDDSGDIIYEDAAGDPEWIGILPVPDDVHSRGNRFGARYTYAILPAGQTLDINVMHNHAKRVSTGAERGFYRHQGVGTFELNLAAFLADLNTNIWNTYEYRSDPLFTSVGLSFEDATEMLNYRYGGGFVNLPSIDELFAAPPGALSLAEVFSSDQIDAYADGSEGSLGAIGSLPTLFPVGAVKPWPSSRYPVGDNDQVTQPWPGGDSSRPNRFFGFNDFWNANDLPDFSRNLGSATNLAPSTYNQSTFYRLISQLGTESIPEQEILEDPTAPPSTTRPRININYRNVEVSVTNLIPWVPVELFTTIASRLLGEEFGFGCTNIPIFTNLSTLSTNTGYPLYNARVQQLLQIAANVVEATRGSKNGEAYPYYPNSFQPLFTQNGLGDIYIRGYEEVTTGFRNRVRSGTVKPYPLEEPGRWPSPSGSGEFDNNVIFYGIPIIVGARKGFPNFNECSLQTGIQTSRKMQFVKDPSASDSARPRETNQMFIIGISNVFGIELWNSYSTPYPRPVELLSIYQSESQLTNANTRLLPVVTVTNNYTDPNRFRLAGWPAAWAPAEPTTKPPPLARPESFWVPAVYHQVVQPDSVYYQSPPHFEALSLSNRFERAAESYTNRWGLAVTNRLLLFMFDDTTGELFDAVSLSGLNGGLDITEALTRPADGRSSLSLSSQEEQMTYELWDPTEYGSISDGAQAQIVISMAGGANWNSFGGQDPTTIGQSQPDAASFFQHFLIPQMAYKGTNPPPIGTVHNAPFVPIRKIYQTTSWHANDPLIHYTLDDLRDKPVPGTIENRTWRESIILTNNGNFPGSGSTIGKENIRYRPWAYDALQAYDSKNGNDVRLSVKDSNVRRSDDWDFPTNKFPNIGWLGRVHRGTPWQTVYLKSATNSEASEIFSEQAWRDQALMSFMKVTDFNRGTTNALLNAPTNDWRLLDVLTASLHPNASRGRLSINQSELAAWSAVMSGVPITYLATNAGGRLAPIDKVVEPAALEPALREIVDGINLARAAQPDGRFHSIGDFLNAPELTVDSPYLRARRTATQDISPLYDSDYERLPQQIMSLLKVGDGRFIIYSFGQSLKPAANSILSSGANFGMCTNYQITAESASRAVVRVDFPPLSTDPTSPNYQKPNISRPHLVVESFNLIPLE